MTKEELKKEAIEYAEGMVKYYASTHEDCIPSQFEKYLRNAYISSAEPREKRIAELEKQHDIVRNERNLFQERCEDILENYYCDHKCKCAELEAEVKEWKDKADLWCKTANLKDHNIMINKELEKENAELKAQIEKLIDFVLSKTECCDVCPITDTCINSEGTCPYAGMLAKGEEEVTREWLMQLISRR